MASSFIKGLRLGQLFFEEVIKPIIIDNFPNLKFDAALIGPGSETLGYDDLVSTDHHWGPRVQLFLSDNDLISYQNEMSLVLSENLPCTFRGYSTNWSDPDPTDANNQFLVTINSGRVNHRIEINSVNKYLKANLAISSLELTDFD